MRMIDVAIPKFDGTAALTDDAPKPAPARPSEPTHRRKASTFVQAPQYLTGRDKEYVVDDKDEEAIDDDDQDEFVLAPDLVEGVSRFTYLVDEG